MICCRESETQLTTWNSSSVKKRAPRVWSLSTTQSWIAIPIQKSTKTLSELKRITRCSMVRLTLRIRSTASARVCLRMDSATRACMKMIKWLAWASRSTPILSSTWVSIVLVRGTVVASSSYQMVVNTRATGERIECMAKVMKDYQMGRVIWSTQTMETVSTASLKAKYAMAWPLATPGQLLDPNIAIWECKIHRIASPGSTVSMEAGCRRDRME